MLKEKDYTISSFGMDRKYSLLYYNDEIVDYNTNSKVNVKRVAEDLKKEDNVVILKNKEMYLIKGNIPYKVVKKADVIQ